MCATTAAAVTPLSRSARRREPARRGLARADPDRTVKAGREAGLGRRHGRALSRSLLFHAERLDKVTGLKIDRCVSCGWTGTDGVNFVGKDFDIDRADATFADASGCVCETQRHRPPAAPARALCSSFWAPRHTAGGITDGQPMRAGRLRLGTASRRRDGPGQHRRSRRGSGGRPSLATRSTAHLA
jgi:hypothetical protein